MIGFLSAAPEVAKLLGAVVQALIEAFASGDTKKIDALATALPTPAVIQAAGEAKIAMAVSLGKQLPPAP